MTAKIAGRAIGTAHVYARAGGLTSTVLAPSP